MNQPNPKVHVGPGATLQSRYLVKAQLGTGSQATVWRCVDAVTDTPVAIKHAADPVEWPNARREYVLLRLLDLPGVVPILDEWVDHGGWFVVMPLLDGSPFPEAADWPRVRTLLRSVLSTLAAMHGRGIVHADLKAANMMVSGDTVTLIDLGFAMDRYATTDLSGCTLSTAAPEQWMGERASPASDVFAMGRVTVNALGARPLGHPDLRTSHRALIHAVASLDVPPDDRAMLTRMLAWEASARPSSTSLVAWLGEDIGRELTIKARHRFDHTPEDMQTLLGTSTVSLKWLLDAGVGKVEGDAVFFTRGEVSRLELALAPRSDDPDAPPLRAVDAGDLDTVLAWCQAAVARPELLRWSLPLAQWSVGHTLATGSERHLDALTLFTSLAVHSEQAQAMHDAALTVDRVAVCTVGGQCRSLLRAAIDVRVHGRLETESVMAVVGSEPRHSSLDPAMTLVRVWHMRRDMGGLRCWLEGELERERDAWTVGRLLTWLAVVAYQQQDYEAGLAAIERKRMVGQLTLSDRANEQYLLLESGRYRRAEAQARSTMILARKRRATEYEATAYANVRAALYRSGRAHGVDVDFPAEARLLSARLAGVAALGEAAIAYRLRLPETVSLANDAAVSFDQAEAPLLANISRAMSAAHTGDRLAADGVVSALPEESSGAIVVQTLALCRMAGARVAPSRIRAAVTSHGSTWSGRREVLSVEECIRAAGIPQMGDGSL